MQHGSKDTGPQTCGSAQGPGPPAGQQLGRHGDSLSGGGEAIIMLLVSVVINTY